MTTEFLSEPPCTSLTKRDICLTHKTFTSQSYKAEETATLEMRISREHSIGKNNTETLLISDFSILDSLKMIGLGADGILLMKEFLSSTRNHQSLNHKSATQLRLYSTLRLPISV